MVDQELVRRMWDLAKRDIFPNHQENALIREAAKRLDGLTRARALSWPDVVRRAYYGEAAYLTGYVDGGIEYDCWVLLYAPRCEYDEPVFAIANKDLMWTIEPGMAGVELWTMMPGNAQIKAQKEWRAQLAERAKNEGSGTNEGEG